MARVSPKERDPVLYERIKKEQKALKDEYSTIITVARICPFCDNKIEILYKGAHGAAHVKCSSCGESVFFPPVFFRIAPT